MREARLLEWSARGLMTEILTESFCERCGTRYTFESTAPRKRRLTGFKVLGRGLRHFVSSDDSSLEEAMATARSDAERELTAHQLDAFHQTFNFCLSCRQYTCANCWSAADARCLSCAPLAVPDVALAAEPAIDADGLTRLRAPAAPASSVTTEVVGEAPIQPAIELKGESIEVDSIEVESLAAHDAAPEVAATAPESARPLVGGMAEGQSLDDAIAAYEATMVDEPTFEDIVEQPVWPTTPPIAQADVAAPVAPLDDSGPPVWPTGPRWPTASPAQGAASPPPAAHDALAALMARKSTDDMWATSSRDVVQPPVPHAVPASVQPCTNCGISLSANARFCRRCGTAQS